MFSASRLIGAAFISGVLVTGCAANGAVTPASNAAFQPSRSFMLPEARTDNLLYVADQINGVIVYTYPPDGFKFVGILNGAPQPSGECVDASQNVWVTEVGNFGNHQVFEFAHGGTTPIATLSVSGSPSACAVDRKTGDLAVLQDGLDLYVFRGSRGKPVEYLSQFTLRFGAYDNAGNLYVEGYVSDGNLQLAKLPKGKEYFVPISVATGFATGGSLQWIGDNLYIGDFSAIYKFSIDGGTAKEIGSTPLDVDSEGAPGQFTIDGARAIVPYQGGDEFAGFLNLYRFPGGGTRTRTLRNFTSPYAAVISRGPKS